MIKCSNEAANFATLVTNGRHQAICDVPAAKGGGDTGFGPHELLEAGLAGCLNIWLRIYAANHGIPLAGITTEVSVQRDSPGLAVFAYAIELSGDLTAEQRQELLQAAKSCPVHQTLSGQISFKSLTG
ncbi:MAG: OsmC family protein [Desulfobaccales bacterium]